ncbi:unnamed protein product [Miscanthus lutarioriparius]|uniref:Transposase n=1 Tax=Miscanthus lutarioriparius TaxID=422564 RepID=A0A811N4X8_9POAL|nr:unnamed protein product [Miscanthus lutarioriparius]
MDKLSVSIDAHKGLEAAVKTIFPQAEHRECFKHLMDNMKKNFRGAIYSKYMWPAARAYLSDNHEYFMSKVMAASAAVLPWLNEHHNLLWARSKFSHDIKCDYINNNLAESWNSWIKENKYLPVYALANAIREQTLKLLAKWTISRALKGTILSDVVHQMNAASKGLGHLKVTKGDRNQAEVSVVYKDEEVRRHVVYLDQKICTCREWERNPNMEQYIDMAFSVEKFKAAYAGVIPNITDRNQWPQADKGFKLQPPVAKPKKKTARRLRKKRILSCMERTGKATRQSKCDGCGELGHMKGSSNYPLIGTKKRKRTKKTKSIVGRKKAKTDAPKEGSSSKRLPLDEPVPLEMVVCEDHPAPAKKMTPRKKQLASKVKKASPTKT